MGNPDITINRVTGSVSPRRAAVATVATVESVEQIVWMPKENAYTQLLENADVNDARDIVRFDPETGETRWAIDKKQTGKQRYRVKMQRRYMETDLMMFACRQTTLFNLLEPRSFRYMTKINLLDARLEAAPLKYWWSRIDTRDSTMASLYLEPETRFKMTLSDTVLRKKMILTGATARRPEGIGYLVNDWPRLYHTEYRTEIGIN